MWFADKNKSLNYQPKSDEMVLTVHRWFANKSYPGDWLYSRLRDVANRVTAQLSGSSGGGSTRGGNNSGNSGSYRTGLYKVNVGNLNISSSYCSYVGAASGGGGSNSKTGTYKIDIPDLYIRKGPGTGYGKNGFCLKGVYTIVETKTANGYTWGRLKSGAGWIALEYAKKM